MKCWPDVCRQPLLQLPLGPSVVWLVCKREIHDVTTALDLNIWLSAKRFRNWNPNLWSLHIWLTMFSMESQEKLWIVLHNPGVADIGRPTYLAWCSLLLSGIWHMSALTCCSLLLRHNHHRAVIWCMVRMLVFSCSQCDHRLLLGLVYDWFVSTDYGPNARFFLCALF